jgi:hypothetical protein
MNVKVVRYQFWCISTTHVSSVMLRTKKLQILNKMWKLKEVSDKNQRECHEMSQIGQRIELCMREIAFCFEMNIQHLLFSSQLSSCTTILTQYRRLLLTVQVYLLLCLNILMTKLRFYFMQEAQYNEFNIGNVNKDWDMLLFTRYQNMIKFNNIL